MIDPILPSVVKLLDASGNPTGNAQTSVLTVAAKSINVTGLAQWDAIKFRFRGKRVAANGITNVFCRPNGVDTNVTGVYLSKFNGFTSVVDLTAWQLAGHNDAARTLYGADGFIHTKVGDNRPFRSEGHIAKLVTSSNVLYGAFTATGHVDDTATAIASLLFDADTDGGLDIGSKVWVWGIKY